MSTLPVVKADIEMNGEKHIFLFDDRYAEFFNSSRESLEKDPSDLNFHRVLDLWLAYEYDCMMGAITDKPDEWIA